MEVAYDNDEGGKKSVANIKRIGFNLGRRPEEDLVPEENQVQRF